MSALAASRISYAHVRMHARAYRTHGLWPEHSLKPRARYWMNVLIQLHDQTAREWSVQMLDGRRRELEPQPAVHVRVL